MARASLVDLPGHRDPPLDRAPLPGRADLDPRDAPPAGPRGARLRLSLAGQVGGDAFHLRPAHVRRARPAPTRVPGEGEDLVDGVAGHPGLASLRALAVVDPGDRRPEPVRVAGAHERPPAVRAATRAPSVLQPDRVHPDGRGGVAAHATRPGGRERVLLRQRTGPDGAGGADREPDRGREPRTGPGRAAIGCVYTSPMVGQVRDAAASDAPWQPDDEPAVGGRAAPMADP